MTNTETVTGGIVLTDDRMAEIIKSIREGLIRFWSKVERRSNQECWEWTSVKSTQGYGRISFNEKGVTKTLTAHRLTYEALIGPIPKGKCLDHLCRNRACVNPYHLETVTKGENTLRGIGITAQNAKKTVCSRGHELAPPNIKIVRRHDGTRRKCRVCEREYAREAKERAK